MSERIHGALDLVPNRSSPGLALDLSAGDGASTRMLTARGWRVIPTELIPLAPGWVAVDLNRDLPFKTAAFDLVMMLEVIEHLADIPHVLHEIARVLRPGASAVISTPNRLNVTSRIHYLLSGFYKGRRAPLPYRYRVADGRNWHVMGLNDLHWIAHGEGLVVEALGRSRRKLRAHLYAPLFYLPIRSFSWMLYGRGERDPAQRRINHELLRLMTSPSLLMDENLVMRLRRTHEPLKSAVNRRAS